MNLVDIRRSQSGNWVVIDLMQYLDNVVWSRWKAEHDMPDALLNCCRFEVVEGHRQETLTSRGVRILSRNFKGDHVRALLDHLEFEQADDPMLAAMNELVAINRELLESNQMLMKRLSGIQDEKPAEQPLAIEDRLMSLFRQREQT